MERRLLQKVLISAPFGLDRTCQNACQARVLCETVMCALKAMDPVLDLMAFRCGWVGQCKRDLDVTTDEKTEQRDVK